MKAKYFMAALFAAFTMGSAFTGCDVDQDPDTYLSDIKVSKSYVAIDVAGGTTTVAINTKSSWYISDIPSWLTVTPKEGEAGKNTLEFTAEKTVDGRSAELLLTLCDSVTTQRINVIQGLSTVSEVSCAEVLAGPDSKTYQVTGTVTAIANYSPYGNFYVNDGTGEVYVYGTLTKDGKEKSDALKAYDVAVGDEVTVKGPKTTYNGTVELVNVTIVKVNKSLLKCDSTMVNGVKSAELPIEGGILTAHLTNKCSGIQVEVPADAQSWLSLVAVKGNVISFKAAANEGGDRATTLIFTANDGKKDYTAKVDIAQKGAVAQVSCAEFNAQADGTAQFKVRGIITSVVNAAKGRFYISDGTGDVYVYGLADLNAAEVKVGNEVFLQSVKTSYNNAPQMKNAVVLETVAHDVKTVADFLAAEVVNTVYYVLRGEVVEASGDGTKKDMETYGNFNIKDETGEVYVYGVLNNLKDKANKQFGTLNVAYGDTITLLGYRATYKGLNQVGGAIFIKNEKKANSNEQ